MSSLFHKRDKKIEQPVNPKLDLNDLDDRESTFRSNNIRWPSSLPAPDLMADAGFYFTPTERNSDCCTCYRCGIKMFNWLPDDIPKYEHKKFSPTCKEAKTWTDVIDDPQRIHINRTEQTESHGKIRSRIADKAKRLTGGFHKKEEAPRPNEPLPSLSKEGSGKVPTPSTSQAAREQTDDEKFAEIKRQREVAERSLEGLEKLAACYHQGSAEQKRAEETILQQRGDLDRLREEENRLASSMSSLSFGRIWNTKADLPEEPLSPTLDAESPLSGRASRRATPKLPSQMKNDAVYIVPAKLIRTPTPLAKPVEDVPSYDSYTNSKNTYLTIPPMDESTPNIEWITYYTEAGIPYYYSTMTKTTVWQIPATEDVIQPVTSN